MATDLIHKCRAGRGNAIRTFRALHLSRHQIILGLNLNKQTKGLLCGGAEAGAPVGEELCPSPLELPPFLLPQCWQAKEKDDDLRVDLFSPAL